MNANQVRRYCDGESVGCRLLSTPHCECGVIEVSCLWHGVGNRRKSHQLHRMPFNTTPRVGDTSF